MTFLELTQEEKNRLKNLNNDKGTIFALKKLFLNVCADKPLSTEMTTLAAERVALEYIMQAFHDLSVIRPEDNRVDNSANPAL